MHYKEYLKNYPTPEKRRELTELSLEKIDLSDENKVLEAFNGLENLTWLELLTNIKPNKQSHEENNLIFCDSCNSYYSL